MIRQEPGAGGMEAEGQLEAEKQACSSTKVRKRRQNGRIEILIERSDKPYPFGWYKENRIEMERSPELMETEEDKEQF